MHGNCTRCGKHNYLRPLHDDKGGPLCCILCSGSWHAKQTRIGRLGRIAARALKAYHDAGGSDFKGLEIAATFGLDPRGYMSASSDEIIELTSELLTDAIKIAHPDVHPPERRELAQRVTTGLLALKPYTLPALVKPPLPQPTASGHKTVEMPKLLFPCAECRRTVPHFYCAACRTEWDSRQKKKHEAESAKRRAQYARRKQRRDQWKPPTICVACGVAFKGKRADARFCSATCRQRAHRDVTDKRRLSPNPRKSVT
jgi:hypothetical protein